MVKKQAATKLAAKGSEGLQKRRPGRPSLGLVQVSAKIRPAERDKSRKAARKEGISWAKWLRRAIRRELARV